MRNAFCKIVFFLSILKRKMLRKARRFIKIDKKKTYLYKSVLAGSLHNAHYTPSILAGCCLRVRIVHDTRFLFGVGGKREHGTLLPATGDGSKTTLPDRQRIVKLPDCAE
jgi:hypothetical protein